jgi:hypothetical protein
MQRVVVSGGGGVGHGLRGHRCWVPSLIIAFFCRCDLGWQVLPKNSIVVCPELSK